MELPRNYLDYPNNVLEPKKKEIDDSSYTIHGFRFKGLEDFYNFLKSNPKINLHVWGGEDSLESINNDYSFAGKPYEEAVKDLIKTNDPGYQEYMKIQKSIHAKKGSIHEYKQIKTVAGGAVNPVDYITGSPTIYRAGRIITKPKFITIDTQIAYNCGTEKSQVFNRAVIITNLIRALERQGYNVNVNSFMAAEDGGEIIQAIFEIKHHGGRTNYQALYKSLVNVEFFRRLCFRIMEVSDVQNNWKWGYGRTCDEEIARKLLNLKKNDIFFDQPDRMGIEGEEIGEDFENAIRKLNLESKVDIEKEKELLRKSVKVLKK